jgi:MFS family permease
LVLGTAFPQILLISPELISPTTLIIIVSSLCIAGGFLVFAIIGDGPFRKPSTRFSWVEIANVYKGSELRNAAFGYFGHMWELYAFWAFIPWWLSAFRNYSKINLNIPLWSFVIIAVGFGGCVIGGLFSKSWGSKKVARIALIASGICCLTSPLIIELPPLLFLLIMIMWGIVVIADSPQLSALVALSSPPEIKGSAITLTTCIGFAITIGSIQLLNYMQSIMANQYLMLWLIPGPLFGIIYLVKPIRVFPKQPL